jgi:Protein of unknown function (DUF2637)
VVRRNLANPLQEPDTRGRFAAWFGFAGGGAVSVAANVAHAQPTLGARLTGAFWPLALLLAVEVITRVQWQPGGWWVATRYAGATLVALVAAIVSYRHMAGLLTRYGEDALAAHLGPLAVDGLMVVSGVALLSLARTVAAPASTYGRTSTPPRAGTTGASDHTCTTDDSAAQTKRRTAAQMSASAPPSAPPAPGSELRTQAEATYRQSVADGRPLKGTELAAQFRRSPRWGQQLIADIERDLDQQQRAA